MHQAIVADDRLAAFQVWQLDVADDRTATLTCRADRDDAPVITQHIDYTDFPLPQIKLWAVCNDQLWTLMLPSEY